MTRITPHQLRAARLLRRQQFGDWRIKLYGIAAVGQAPRAELVEATAALAARVLPPANDEHYGIGFAIAHDSAKVCFGLVYWWQSSNELHQRVHVSPHDAPGALLPVSDPAAGCVWELGIIDFERRAWIEDVLANSAGPDFNRYLARELNADL